MTGRAVAPAAATVRATTRRSSGPAVLASGHAPWPASAVRHQRGWTIAAYDAPSVAERPRTRVPSFAFVPCAHAARKPPFPGSLPPTYRQTAAALREPAPSHDWP